MSHTHTHTHLNVITHHTKHDFSVFFFAFFQWNLFSLSRMSFSQAFCALGRGHIHTETHTLSLTHTQFRLYGITHTHAHTHTHTGFSRAGVILPL